MPIREGSPKACFDRFVGHVQDLVARVLDSTLYVAHRIPAGAGLHCDMQLGAFGDKAVKLKSTTHSRIYLYMAQDLVAIQAGGQFELRTRKYWYKVYEREPELEDDPLFRWEYAPGECGSHCRHHFHVGKGTAQKSVCLPLGNSDVDLNKIHIPTRYVLIEDILRFLIADLGVAPLAADWETLLNDSERAFFTEFSSKASLPP